MNAPLKQQDPPYTPNAALEATIVRRTSLAIVLVFTLTMMTSGMSWLAMTNDQKAESAHQAAQHHADQSKHHLAEGLYLRAEQAMARKHYSKAAFYSAQAYSNGYGSKELWERAVTQDPLIWLSDVPRAPANAINQVAFSPDGKTLAAESSARLVQLWAVASGAQRENFTYDAHQVSLPDSEFLAKILYRHEFNADAGLVNGIAFSPDGKIRATVGADNRGIFLWGEIARNCNGLSHIRIL